MQTPLFTHEEAQRPDVEKALAALGQWILTYPMSEHVALGRSGTVCPFLKQASRIDTLRIGISLARPGDEEAVFADMRSSFAELQRIPAPNGKDRLRTIAVGFPNCSGEDGIAMLQRVYKRHKYYTLLRSRMIAFFHPEADVHGLWNPDFRSMRAPMPVLAVRYLVEQDAVFAAKHKLLTIPYLMRFGVGGARRLMAHWRRKAEARADV